MTRWRDLRPRTLRSRIVASVLVLLVIGFAAVGIITTLVVHRVLLDRLDTQLAAAGNRFAVSLEHNDHDADNASQFNTVEGQATGTLGARLLRGTVTAAAVVGHHDATGAPSAAADAVLAQLTVSSTPRTIQLPGLGDYRVIITNGRDGDQQVTGLPLQGVEETTRRLITINAIVDAGALVAVGIASAWLVRRTLRPLGRVADTASKVAALPLATGSVSLPDRAPSGPAGSEVEAVAAAFNRMLEEVEAAFGQRHESEEQLRRFVADASHELRTPVAVVRSQAEYAQRVGGDALPREVAEALGRITVQSERMGHLVDDLLLLARLDSGRPLAREPVDLTRVVLDAVSEAKVAAPHHRWQLELPDSTAVVTGDELALHQIVANLLTNARIHTAAGTTVTAALRPGSEGTVVLTVADDGAGIAADVADRVLERFVRGYQSRAHTTGSSGLGLPIVAAIVAAHDGKMQLDTRPSGTRVTVTLTGAFHAQDTDG